MKKSELRTIIRTMVREEVAMAIQEVITEIKQPSTQIAKKTSTKKDKIVEKKNFSSNSIINDILNETAQKPSDWDTLGGGTFDSSRMNEVMAKQYEGMGTKEGGQAHLAASLGADPNNPPDFLTKDYSQLMQKVDEKAKQTRG